MLNENAIGRTTKVTSASNHGTCMKLMTEKPQDMGQTDGEARERIVQEETIATAPRAPGLLA